jgi:hypothetical protein
MRVSVCCFLLCISISFSSAQESTASPISTERPTAGYSPDVVPGGDFQTENGLGIEAQLHRAAVDLPENLIRLGVFDRYEVRFQSSDSLYQTQQPAGASRWQTTDIAISGKLLIGQPNTFSPRSGVLNLSVPTGGPSETSGSFDPGAALIWTQSLKHGWSFNEDAIATLTKLHGARRPVWAPSLYAGKGVNDKLSAFAELAPSVLQDRSTTWLLDGGFAWLASRNRQIDVRAGYFHDAAGCHTLLSLGISVRRERMLKLLESQPMLR